MKSISELKQKYKGLSEKEAKTRLTNDGFNEILKEKNKSFLRIVLEVLKEPMFILLIACAIIYIFIGDLEGSIMLICCVGLIIGITIFQERKVEKALSALRNLSSPRALVIREGKERYIPGREVVTGDIVIIKEGDRIPADGIILFQNNVSIDESVLTGESIPVLKREWKKEDKNSMPGGDNLPFVYSSTLVVLGYGVMKVTKTGALTEVGKIGKSLFEISENNTVLKDQTRKLIKAFGLFGLLACITVVILYTILMGDFSQGVIIGLALGMSAIPEEFPVVLVLFLTFGAYRMSKKNVLTRDMNAIENLGCTSVLCVDKTGTITLNKMEIKELYSNKKFYLANELLELKGENSRYKSRANELIYYSVLASNKETFDPIDKAIREFYLKNKSGSEKLFNSLEMIKQYPISKELLALSHVWKERNGKYLIASKGAPEAIIGLCRLNANEKRTVINAVKQMARQGLKVLGVARAHFSYSKLPKKQEEFDYEFLGLLGFEDPIRENISDYVSECYEAGINVVMITGDYKETAKRIAIEAGFKDIKVMCGKELANLNDSMLKKRIVSTNIFARVVPEQKLRIVNALKKSGKIVIMTGDGVNDAPALKSAHVGIAMGNRGTDVARESSSMVLLDDNFESIVTAIKTGRHIFSNIKKAMSYIVTVHIPIALLAIAPVLLGFPPILLPVHIALMELIIDPTCSVVFEEEGEEEDIMKQKPRNPKEPLLDKGTIVSSVLEGIVIFLFVMFGYIIFQKAGFSYNKSRAFAFSILVTSYIFLVLAKRSFTKTIFESLKQRNGKLWVVVLIIGILLLSALYAPFMQRVFGFDPLGFRELIMAGALGLLSVLGLELIKLSKRKAFARNLPR